MANDDDRGFGQGMAVGFAIAAVAVHLALVVLDGNLSAMYRDLGTVQLPLMTRVALSDAWRFGVPLAGGVAIGTLIIRRPRSLVFYVAVAVALGAAVAITWWYPQAPIHALAGNIQD